jgi:hypothetical protein
MTNNGQSNLTDIPYNIDIKKNFTNIKTISLSSIGKDLSYIPLETTPECIISKIEKTLFSGSYIFVSEKSRLLQFDKNGRFVKQIGSSGRGPEEMFLIQDFCIDEQKKEIYIISAPDKLSIFDFDGVFKNSFHLSVRTTQIIPSDNNSLMFHIANVPGKNDPSWIITNKQGIVLSNIKNYLKRISQPGIIVPYSPLYLFDNTLHFMEFGIDTLYYFKVAKRKPYAIFYFDNLKMNPDLIVNSSMVKINHENLTGTLWINSIIENDELLFITFSLGVTDAEICAIYNKKTDAVTFLKDNAFQNDVDEGIMFWPKQVINDNLLIDYVDAFDLLKKQPGSLIKNNYYVSSKLLNLKKQISETSNPVLIILKL